MTSAGHCFYRKHAFRMSDTARLFSCYQRYILIGHRQSLPDLLDVLQGILQTV